MDLNADIMQREGMQSTYSTLSSAGDMSTTTASAHSIATQALMPGLFAFQSLTPGSTVQPYSHSMSYLLPSSDSTASTLTGGLATVGSAGINSLQSPVTPAQTGMTRAPPTIPVTLLQPSSTVYSHSNRVSE